MKGSIIVHGLAPMTFLYFSTPAENIIKQGVLGRQAVSVSGVTFPARQVAFYSALPSFGISPRFKAFSADVHH